MVVSAALDCTATELTDQLVDRQDYLFERQQIFPKEGRKWWVLYTKSRQEKALARYLSAMCIPYYLPLYEKHSLIRGRRFTSWMPLFSGYVFLFGDRAERVTALESNRIARTIDVTSSRQAELGNDLLGIQRLIESGVPLSMESQIQPGRRVRVKNGRLAGLEGTVTKRRGRSRLLIAVNYLQQGASVEISDFCVETI